jgi:hypothetical protein
MAFMLNAANALPRGLVPRSQSISTNCSRYWDQLNTKTIMKTLAAAATLLSLSIPGPKRGTGQSVVLCWLGLGTDNLDVHNLSDVGTATSNIAKAEDNAWKLFAGWRLNPHIAFGRLTSLRSA